MKTTTKQKNFTMISDKLCRVPIKKISQTEKLYIAYILRYQANGNTLFASNKSIGEQLGIDGGSVKKLNNKMNKQFNFFSATQDKKYENGIEYSSSHTIKIDEKLLDEFLDNVSMFVKEKPSKENKALKTNISIKPIIEDQVEEIVSEIEEKQLTRQEEAMIELKKLLQETYYMKGDLERKLITILGSSFNKFEFDAIVKQIIKDRISTEQIEEFLQTKQKQLVTN